MEHLWATASISNCQLECDLEALSFDINEEYKKMSIVHHSQICF